MYINSMLRHSQPTQKELNGISAHFFFCLVLLGLGIFFCLTDLFKIYLDFHVCGFVCGEGLIVFICFFKDKKGEHKVGWVGR